MANPIYGSNKADGELAKICDVSSFQAEYTETAVVDSKVIRCLELNHATVVIAITGMQGKDYAGQMVCVKDTSASGTANHLVTLSSGTWDGTSTIVTFNAPNEAVFVFFDSAGNGTIVENANGAVFS